MKRYDLATCSHCTITGQCDAHMVELPDGDYVQFEDVAALPAWHDRPTCGGRWMAKPSDCTEIRLFELDDEEARTCRTDIRWRWYGPIPDDKPT